VPLSSRQIATASVNDGRHLMDAEFEERVRQMPAQRSMAHRPLAEDRHGIARRFDRFSVVPVARLAMAQRHQRLGEPVLERGPLRGQPAQQPDRLRLLGQRLVATAGARARHRSADEALRALLVSLRPEQVAQPAHGAMISRDPARANAAG
jgi:hypothetical protein